MRQYDFSSLKILIVDDDRFFLSILTHILHGFGVREITVATSVLGAIDRCSVNEFDVAFVDCRMPLNDGFDFINYIRRDEECVRPSLPIIMVSAYAKRDVVKSAIETGADSFLVKPIRACDVHKRLVALIEHPYSFVRIAEGYTGRDTLKRPAQVHAPADPAEEHSEDESTAGTVTILV